MGALLAHPILRSLWTYMETTRDNHYVPRWYLRRWANASDRVWRYSTLVSHEAVRVWEPKSLKSVGFQTDLYTSECDGLLSDEFEHWLEREFEQPAQIAISRVLAGEPLSPHHWQHLGRFAICQQLRTPQDLSESMQRWKPQFEKTVGTVLQDAVNIMEGLASESRGAPRRTGRRAKFLESAFKVDIDPDGGDSETEGRITVRTLLDREFWLNYQRHILDGVGWRAALHSWSIVSPAPGAIWFTSDQPVLRLNYRDDGFDLNGGWGNTNGNICLPLSPHHMLFTQIGADLPSAIQFDARQTSAIQHALALRAHRAVFADRKMSLVEKFRPRVVDAEAFKAEQEARRRWHSENITARTEHGGVIPI